MAWTTWRAMYLKWLEALASRDIDSFFNSSYDNSREMRTTYTVLNNISMFTEWLKAKADQEDSGSEDGEILMCIGGC
jgi:hypothetical protein